ncbi:unnamed protein product [Rodentolepis nana]|uniref:Secreted protein n=1 Tax=Rodentolepis nana TaxID=102285 RepID=A0A0R3THC9_RODNA|nr:unnamed protein product [Rodentolepis nana]
MRIWLHICTTMEPEQLLIYSWLQATSASKHAAKKLTILALVTNQSLLVLPLAAKACQGRCQLSYHGTSRRLTGLDSQSSLKNELHISPLNSNQYPDKLFNDITNIMVRCAKKTVPRGKTKHYRVFWSNNLRN